ncbi:TatD family hydrolase [Microbulbifer sp.]|uniref:TatD family hydrolase n=1 Tax=Microbulbifer sp. TaxID=1908541 RepID=UPI002590DD99|nr:TatD family hydrolase [Microbulbifer sp.]
MSASNGQLHGCQMIDDGLIDSHCHLDFDAFAADRDAVWQRSRAAGVSSVIIPGVSIRQWRTLFALVRNNPDWYGAVGVHPWWVKDLAIAPTQLQQAVIERVDAEMRSGSRCVAVGECGLDALIKTPMDRQLAVFRPQLAAACDLELPLIVHGVKAHSEVLRALKQFRPRCGGVIHAFAGSEEIAREYWNLGFYLGIGGTITYPRAAKTRRTVAAVPAESLILESDAPDMPHAGRQGERNSPEYLPNIALTLAELRGTTVEDVTQATASNTRQLFDL